MNDYFVNAVFSVVSQFVNQIKFINYIMVLIGKFAGKEGLGIGV